jgi:hypothetical protein
MKFEHVLEISRRIHPRGEKLTDKEVSLGRKGFGRKNLWYRLC